MFLSSLRWLTSPNFFCYNDTVSRMLWGQFIHKRLLIARLNLPESVWLLLFCPPMVISALLLVGNWNGFNFLC